MAELSVSRTSVVSGHGQCGSHLQTPYAVLRCTTLSCFECVTYGPSMRCSTSTSETVSSSFRPDCRHELATAKSNGNWQKAEPTTQWRCIALIADCVEAASVSMMCFMSPWANNGTDHPVAASDFPLSKRPTRRPGASRPRSLWFRLAGC